MRSMDMADLQRMAGDWIEPDPAPVPIQSTNHSHHHGNGSTFDIVDFLRRNNVEYKYSPHNGGTKYVLAECPFDRAHKSPDAAVFVGADGKLGFRCLHNSCAGYHWHDFRAFYEPRKNEIVNHQPPAATP